MLETFHHPCRLVFPGQLVPTCILLPSQSVMLTGTFWSGWPDGSRLCAAKLTTEFRLTLGSGVCVVGSSTNTDVIPFLEVVKSCQLPIGWCLKLVESSTVSRRVPAETEVVYSPVARAKPSGEV